MNDVNWNRAVARTALRLKTEFRVTTVPESVGMPIAVRAVSILGQELGMIPRGTGLSLKEMEDGIVEDEVKRNLDGE